MANDTKIHFFTKSGDPETPQVIYMQFSYYERMKFSIGEKIKPILWNKELERCIISNSLTQAQERHARRVNKYIEHIEKEVSVRLSNRNKFIPNPSYWDISRIKEHVKKVMRNYKEKEVEEKIQKELTPSEYFTQYIASLPHRVIKRTGLYMSANTIEHHKIVLKRYEKFIRDGRWIDRFELFDKKFETHLETWCYKSQNYTPNTIATSFSIMKVWLNQAEEDGLIKTRDFHTWKSKSDDVVHIYLTDEEIERMYKIEFTDEIRKQYKFDHKSNIEETRDLFVIACNLGLRLADWDKLNYSEWNFDKNTITVNTSKTKERVTIPLSDAVKEIYKKYEGNLPRPIDKSHLNKQLQKCGEIAGINDDIFILEKKGGKAEEKHYKKYQLISSHCGRRSFATNLYKKCKSSLMVMKFTGHKTEDSFYKYICVDKIENAEDAQQYFKSTTLQTLQSSLPIIVTASSGKLGKL